MLTLNTLLREAGIEPAQVMVMRHRPIEAAIRRKLPWIVAEKPALFVAYQAMQWKAAEKAMAKAKLLASFIGTEPGEAVFAGLFEVRGHRALERGEYGRIPENVELIALGMQGRAAEFDGGLLFDLVQSQTYVEWQGRLIIRWPPPERAWWRWSERNTLPVEAILEESCFSEGMPSWDQLSLSWSDLAIMPRAWRAKLAEWRGIYFIFDEERRSGYVGSAYGRDNILGRWTNYADTGHGGNKELRASNPDHLIFSILQRTSPDTPPEEVTALESTWKQRLHTREFGLNAN